MKTILLTGATGYLGSHLLQHFVSKGFVIIALCKGKQRPLSFLDHKNIKTYFLEETLLQTIFNENSIDIVIHTATCYGRNGESPAEIAMSNIVFPLDLCDLAANNNVKMFINTDTILVNNINVYAKTKNQFAQWLDMYCHKLVCINMRLDHFYGPHDNNLKFIAYLIEQFKNDAQEIDLTEGAQTRDFIYIDDVVKAFECIVKHYKKMSCDKVHNFEVGTNIKTSIKSIVKMLQSMMGNTSTQLNFGAIPYRKNEVLDYSIDTSALKLLGWSANVSVEEGLRKIIQEENL